MAIVNRSVVLPVEYGREIIRGLVGRSKALELGRRLPDMRGKTYKLNVNSYLPVAGWVKNSQVSPNSEGTEINRKPVSTYAFEGIDLIAEELAVIVPISENTLADVEDFGIELAGELEEQVVGAFQQAIDEAVFFGVNTPWGTQSGFPVSGGLVGGATGASATVSWNGQGDTAFYNAINQAMTLVEKSGYMPNAILGGPSLNSAFRSSITTLGINVTDQGEIGGLARHIDLTGGFNESTAFAIVGDFRYLVYSFREEMEMKLLTESSIYDPNTGALVYALAQQDMVALRFKMRLAFALPKPVNRVSGTLSSDGKYIEKGASAYPFAVITKSNASA